MSTALGINFIASDWPEGLVCPGCRHVFADGDRFTEVLDGFIGDVPACQVMCLACALPALDDGRV